MSKIVVVAAAAVAAEPADFRSVFAFERQAYARRVRAAFAQLRQAGKLDGAESHVGTGTPEISS